MYQDSDYQWYVSAFCYLLGPLWLYFDGGLVHRTSAERGGFFQ
jgi:hypothetical protein